MKLIVFLLITAASLTFAVDSASLLKRSKREVADAIIHEAKMDDLLKQERLRAVKKLFANVQSDNSNANCETCFHSQTWESCFCDFKNLANYILKRKKAGHSYKLSDLPKRLRETMSLKLKRTAKRLRKNFQRYRFRRQLQLLLRKYVITRSRELGFKKFSYSQLLIF